MQPTVGTVRRTTYLVYGAICYAIFLATFLYAMAFVGNFWPGLGLEGELLRSMDVGGPDASLAKAFAIDLALLGLFAVQHSVMARSGFKRWWTRIVSPVIERSTYVLAASLCLVLLFWQWRPIGAIVLWDASQHAAGVALMALSLAGWLLVLCATFMLDHFALFGLHQVWSAFRNRALPEPTFATPAMYKAVRHPIYLGFIIAFWATPVMTLGHLVFAAATTGYVLIAIRFEERDLIRSYGDAYRAYRRRVRMLLPFPRQMVRVLAEPPERDEV
jgi:protein-S-isoprenylcysteine O-methyltransferase Ste14